MQLINESIEGKSVIIENVPSVAIDKCHFGLVDWTQKKDSLSIGKVENVSIKNSVIRWGVDECLGLYDINNLLVSDCLIYESLNNTGHPGGGGYSGTNHGCGALYWTRRPDCKVRFERVLFAHHNYRGLCNVAAKTGASVVSDFVNCVSIDCWNYYFNDTGEKTTDRNIRGCVFIQTGGPFKPSMWISPGRLFIEDSWCIDADGVRTKLEDQLSPELRSRIVDYPFSVSSESDETALPSDGLLDKLIDNATKNIKLDFHDVRVLGRLASHDFKTKWTGVIDRKPIFQKVVG